MNVLILGSGAREHSLGWKLKKQGECRDIWIHPGNAGIKLAGFQDFGKLGSLSDLLLKAKDHSIDLVVIGPENLLAQGYANAFREIGIRVLGPNKDAARLETSKVFAKDFMNRAGIPTAPSQVFTSFQDLVSFSQNDWPWVLKLDGLAAGKGVIIAKSQEDVRLFGEAVWLKNLFGSGPHQVLAEDFIPGREISYIGFCDGHRFIPLASATDHKRVFDGDLGANTGGMGAISPSPYMTTELEAKIENRVIAPFLKTLKESHLDFRGILFVGLMIDDKGDPSVLEFNTRFGDPETECVLPRLQSSLLELLVAAAEGKLKEISKPSWDSKTSVYVVACSPGYPEAPRTGSPVSGLDSIRENSILFFAGVASSSSGLICDGGRVLGVGALDATPVEARKKAYQLLSQIHWPGIHFRKDIGI
jgi:phosphoribosylamine--glycine ligase